MKYREDVKTAIANLRNGHGLTPEQTLDVIGQLLERVDCLERVASHLLLREARRKAQDGRHSEDLRLLRDILKSPA